MNYDRNRQNTHINPASIGLLGAAIGAVVAVMMRDDNTRKEVIQKVAEFKKQAHETWNELREKIISESQKADAPIEHIKK